MGIMIKMPYIVMAILNERTITMSEKKLPEPVASNRVVRVTKAYNVAGGALRQEPKVIVARTGACTGNTAAKEMIQDFFRALGHNPEDFEVALGGVEADGMLHVYEGKPKAAGNMKPTLNRNDIRFHAGGAFQIMPKLRPVTRVECSIKASTDEEGEPCLVINVGGGAPVRTQKRKKAEETESE